VEAVEMVETEVVGTIAAVTVVLQATLGVAVERTLWTGSG
jgi:hypothetical protein